jgi:hypothetical protein
MSTEGIVAIAILATRILMMRFRKRWLAKINIAFTNRLRRLWFAGCDYAAAEHLAVIRCADIGASLPSHLTSA